jgi:hypothetical protein
MVENKAFADLLVRISALGTMQGSVGWYEDKKYPGGMPVAEVAQMQEFGTGTIPARPFMRPAIINNQKKWEENINKVSGQVVKGNLTAKTGMDVILKAAASDVVESIKAVDSPPLSQITLGIRKYKQQGKQITGKTVGEVAARLKAGTLDVSGVSTKPLNDTGNMIATLTFHNDTK